MCRIMECLVVSEAEIERVNSHMRRQLHYQRSRLLPKTIENILYIKYSQYSWEQFIEKTENDVINAINQE
ncbi:HAT [Hexamita inflata]|uniref:C-terminal dimerisation domain n=1 Tax=Hexamita inflata TaxID=28002 RepID=A0AA86RAZ0_9EUKA|nr:C-terminal dimerisation domain [Hexamita inflata]